MTDGHQPSRTPRLAIGLGVAGLLPMVGAVLAPAFIDDHLIGVIAGTAYAAAILSFLGGSWWGIAGSRADAPRWLFVAAVVPSLIASPALIVFFLADTSGVAQLALALAILAMPLVDLELYRRRLVDRAYLVLRVGLSVWLAVLTAALMVPLVAR